MESGVHPTSTRRWTPRSLPAPHRHVVVLTTYSDDESVSAALAAGALGYLTEDAGREDIGRALGAAARGQGLLDPAVHGGLVAMARSTGSSPRPAADRAQAIAYAHRRGLH